MSTMLQMPSGALVEAGGPEDRATWTKCERCGFLGGNVGTDPKNRPACMGIVCGGVTPNPKAPRLPGAKIPRPPSVKTPGLLSLIEARCKAAADDSPESGLLAMEKWVATQPETSPLRQLVRKLCADARLLRDDVPTLLDLIARAELFACGGGWYAAMDDAGKWFVVDAAGTWDREHPMTREEALAEATKRGKETPAP
jgi:hypothetical protein